MPATKFSANLTSLLLVLALSSVSLQSHAEDSCQEWFNRTKISPTNPDCELECASSKVDMGSFDCPVQCAKFCKAKTQKCAVTPFWDRALAAESKPLKRLSLDQSSRVRKILSKMPKSFEPRSLNAIVTTTAPFDMFNPSNAASSSDEYLILFPRAFSESENLERLVIHELVHQLVRNEWVKELKDYSKSNGWSSRTEDVRPGQFVEADGRQSPEEDFANNVEYFLFDPNALKKVSPKIFSWIEKNLGPRLKMEKGCK